MTALSSLISLNPPGSDYNAFNMDKYICSKLDSVLIVRLYDRVTDLLNENQA